MIGTKGYGSWVSGLVGGEGWIGWRGSGLDESRPMGEGGSGFSWGDGGAHRPVKRGQRGWKMGW